MKTIKLKVDELIVDRTQYKPYTSRLTSDNLFVQVTLGDHNVEKQNKDETILTPEGLASVMDQIATAIDNMNDEHRINKFHV